MSLYLIGMLNIEIPFRKSITNQFEDLLVLILFGTVVISFALVLFNNSEDNLIVFAVPAVFLSIAICNSTVGVKQETNASVETLKNSESLDNINVVLDGCQIMTKVFAQKVLRSRILLCYLVTSLILLTLFIIRAQLRVSEIKFPSIQYPLAYNLTIVAMPLVPSQVDAVHNNLETWIQYPPCKPNTSTSITHFCFVLPRVLDDEDMTDHLLDPTPASLSEMKMAEQLLSLVNHTCFASYSVRWSPLRKQDDNHLDGSKHSFLSIINPASWTGLPLGYVLLMEPDTVPVQPFWLESLHQIANYRMEPFWVQGSSYWGDVPANHRHMFHINGNAIYNMGDDTFYRFQTQIVNHYLRWKYGNLKTSFDVDTHDFLTDTKVSRDFVGKHLHLFRYTHRIQNYGFADYNINSVRQLGAVIVHKSVTKH